MTATRIFETPWGRMGVGASARGLVRVVLPGRANRAALSRLERLDDGQAPHAAQALVRKAEREIREYLQGRRRAFTLAPDLEALPPFQRKALRAVQRIPYGRTATYSEVASRVGLPRAARAVGQAVARNPVPLVVPCHRVVAAHGLGGFSGGAALKRRLLALEGTYKGNVER